MLWRELRKLLPGGVVRDVESFVKRVKSLCPDAKVYLFESYAKGMRLRDSDIDLVFAYTPQELEEAKKRSIVIRDA
jgi:predicted nucleotidyltransferase